MCFLVYFYFWDVSLQLMVTGVRGSLGESARLPVAAEREHESDSVTTRLLATVAGRAQETLPSCPGVTLRPAQVRYLYKCKNVGVCLFADTLLKYKYFFFFVRWAPEGTRQHHREHQ